MADPAVYNAILEENRRMQASIQDAQAAAAASSGNRAGRRGGRRRS